MHLLFLNQYGPPDSPPTARLLGELADQLRTGGHTVEILAQRQTYGGRPTSGRERLRRELAASWFILRAGWRRRTPRPDVVLALSSPPGLLVVAALVAWRQRARLAHWAMDLYPELAVALGEIPSGFVAKAVQVAMGWAYRRCALVVALDDDMRDHLQTICLVPVRVLPPWPSQAVEQQIASGRNPDTSAPNEDRSTVPWTWLYSGNLGRAHEWQTLLGAQCLLENRGLPVRLAFQGDGAARQAARAGAKELGLQRCEWLDYVPEAQLLASLRSARAWIVTQRPETRGLLWPSKLAVLEKLPGSIVFVGPVDGAIAQRLQTRGSAGIFALGDAPALADWVQDQFKNGPSLVPLATNQPSAADGCTALEKWLTECFRSGR